MFKQILVSTDGSKLSQKAIRAAVRLAAATGAAVTGVYVIAPYIPRAYGEGVTYISGLSPSRYKEATQKEARKALAAIEVEAGVAGVPYQGVALTADNPWQGIIHSVRRKKCDLIVMASHGRRGLSALVLGSETTKVLTHSKIPVLVCR